MPSSKVKEWLEKTGVPLEMEAASAFHREGFEVAQSYVYADSQLEKSREIDVYARDPDFLGVIDISFVLECKASPKPWVVLKQSTGPIQYNMLHSFSLTSPAALKRLANRLFQTPIPEYVRAGSTAGYGIRQAFTDDGESSGAACIPLLKAGREIVRNNGVPKLPRHAFCFPALVVAAPLFECSLLESGELSISEVESSSFLLQAQIPQTIGCKVTIVTRSYLPTFAKQARELARTIRADWQSVQDAYFEPRSAA